MTRVIDAWRELTPERRTAALAAIGLLVTMFLPWYQQNAAFANEKHPALESRNLDAFQVFSFAEAAVLVVAVAVCYMLFARAEGRQFQLPGGDGTIVLAAGLWAALLLVFRLFDKPGISSNGVAANVGVQWGIFFALGAAGMLAYSGQRMRPDRGHRPHGAPALREDAEPKGAAEEVGTPEIEATEVRSEPPPAPERPRYPPAPAPATAAGRTPRSRPPDQDAPEQEQLSFEEESPGP